jgi:hypothetical protein
MTPMGTIADMIGKVSAMSVERVAPAAAPKVAPVCVLDDVAGRVFLCRGTILRRIHSTPAFCLKHNAANIVVIAVATEHQPNLS